MISEYFYDEQIRAWLLQFCAIFSGMQVQTGKDASGNTTMMNVPIHIGNKDRVVAAIMASNTQNKTFSLPIMAAWMQGIELAPERRKGIGVTDARVHLPSGGVFPDDLHVVRRVMPVPYNLSMELAIYTSNTQQLHQIMEQIMVLFDPILQIQTTDAPFDWTKITSVELTGINNEENYPPGGDKRIINWTLNFVIPIWISAPLDLRKDVVRKIIITIGDIDSFVINEYDADGNLVPFITNIFGTSIIDTLNP